MDTRVVVEMQNKSTIIFKVFFSLCVVFVYFMCEGCHLFAVLPGVWEYVRLVQLKRS